MSTTGVKIVLDTNILIAIIGRKSPYRWIFDEIIDGGIILCVSNEIILEYKEILQKKAGKVVASNMIGFFTIHPYVEKFEPFYKFQLITHDNDDNKFVDCAIAANASCIVTNDKHFNEVKQHKFPKVNVLSISEFENKFRR
ncbi:MAG: putative toxin-antitoxin system toxin component, PIN family [Bacteroidales bacterium]|nr:putative toxin-antitoxin system toxin component, PIN family [Bacteroidales bacterium]